MPSAPAATGEDLREFGDVRCNGVKVRAAGSHVVASLAHRVPRGGVAENPAGHVAELRRCGRAGGAAPSTRKGLQVVPNRGVAAVIAHGLVSCVLGSRGVKAVVAAMRSRAGSRGPLTRGRLRRPVRGGGSSCKAASLRSRVVQVTHAGQFPQFLPGVGGVAGDADGAAGQGFGEGLGHAVGQPQPEAEFVPLTTSLASTGRHTGRDSAGGVTMIPAITQVVPVPSLVLPGRRPVMKP